MDLYIYVHLWICPLVSGYRSRSVYGMYTCEFGRRNPDTYLDLYNVCTMHSCVSGYSSISVYVGVWTMDICESARRYPDTDLDLHMYVLLWICPPVSGYRSGSAFVCVALNLPAGIRILILSYICSYSFESARMYPDPYLLHSRFVYVMYSCESARRYPDTDLHLYLYLQLWFCPPISGYRSISANVCTYVNLLAVIRIQIWICSSALFCVHIAVYLPSSIRIWLVSSQTTSRYMKSPSSSILYWLKLYNKVFDYNEFKNTV